MAVRIKVLVGYRSKIDPTIWYRYAPLDDEEMKAHNEHAAKETSDDEDVAHARDLVAHVKELWHVKECYDDPVDIYDTLMEANGAVLGSEIVYAMLRRAHVVDADAPFLSPPSTGS